LNKIFPGVPGTSQATVSKVLSENRNVQKTDKIEPVKTKTDLDSSPVENTPTITNEKNSEEPALESTPKDSDSDSVNSEASAGVNVPQNPNFDECMKLLEEAEEFIIRKVKFLSSEEVETILKRIEDVGNNIYDQALELNLVE
jgi:hypothetical protein